MCPRFHSLHPTERASNHADTSGEVHPAMSERPIGPAHMLFAPAFP